MPNNNGAAKLLALLNAVDYHVMEQTKRVQPEQAKAVRVVATSLSGGTKMKKFFIFCLLAVFSAALFAQNAKSTGVTDSDVKNWAKNLPTIVKEFDKIGIDPADSYLEAIDEKEKVENVLQKNGISGPDRIAKFETIVRSAAILKIEAELDEDSKEMMKLMNMDPTAELKKNINQKDYDVVAANSKAVIKAMDAFDDD